MKTFTQYWAMPQAKNQTSENFLPGRLSEALAYRGLLMTDAAKAVNLSKGHLSGVLSGKKDLGVSGARKLADFLRVPFEWLYMGSGPNPLVRGASVAIESKDDDAPVPPGTPVSREAVKRLFQGMQPPQLHSWIKKTIAELKAADTPSPPEMLELLEIAYEVHSGRNPI